MNNPSATTSSSAAAGPSRTTTVAANPPPENDVGILRLRPAPQPSTTASRRVIWTDETIDNEFLNKKKSKICCIYHKPKAFDESSDESSSSSGESETSESEDESDSDGGVGVSSALKQRLREQRGHGHEHEHAHDGHEGCTGVHGGKGTNGKAKRGKQNVRSSGGTQTIAVTQEPTEQENGAREDSDDDGESGGFRPNAYERGTR